MVKKVLWIHWFKRTSNVVDFFEVTKNNLEKEWIEMIAPEFEVWENIKYKNWEKKLYEIWVWKYDVIICHSMWCRVIIEYLSEKQINIKKIILVAPAINVKTKEVMDFYLDMKHDFKEVGNLVWEIIILVSDDDTVIRIEWAKDLANELNAKLIETTWYWHFNFSEVKIIEDLIKS